MGSFVFETMGLLEDDVIHKLLVDIGKVIVNLVSGVHVLEAERDEQNSPAEGNAIPVLVHQLVKVRGRDFAKMISMHRDRMRSRWTDAQIDKIEQEHAALVELYKSDTYQRKQIDKSDDTTEFEESWSAISGRFGYLCRFAGGLATVFPGTSSVESDFSILKWGKPTAKCSLTDFLLEGLIHAKQYEQIRDIRLALDSNVSTVE